MRKLMLPVVLLLAAALASSAAAVDNVAVPSSGWLWGNPQPQGNTLNDLAFAGGSGYAAGDDGTLLKTTNSGLTWRGLAPGVAGDLQRVRALDANVLFAGGGCSLRRSDDGGATFARVNATPSERKCPATVTSFSFVDPMTGYVLLSNGAVSRTADGGHSFSARLPVPGTAAAGGAPPAAATDIWFLSSETGLALAGPVIYRTTDGGASWTAALTASQPLNGLTFVSTTTGYAAGDGKTLLKTTDGGVTWTPQEIAAELPAADLTGVRCAADQPNRCLISTRQGDQLLRTANGGNTITSVVAYSGRKILAAAFASAGSAAAVGAGGASAVSGDAGQNWAPVGTSVGSAFARLRAMPSRAVHAVGGGGALARTANGGADWQRLPVPTPENLVDTTFPSDAAGFALDAAGALFKTVDGGAHWTPTPATGVTRPRAVFAPDPATVLLLGADGLARSTDGGEFKPVDSGQPEPIALTDYDRTGAGLIVYGPRALMASDASGSQLQRIQRPGGKRAQIRSADFVSAGRGYVLNRDGRLWLTRDGGAKWSEIRTTGSARGYDMAWADAKNGYLAIDRVAPGEPAGYVLRTADGGHTWRPQLVAPTPLRRGGLVTTGRSTAVALAGASQLLYTASGGDRGADSTLTITSSTTRITRSTKVVIKGRIEPAVAGADVQVAIRALGGTRWTTYVPKPTGAEGRFRVKARVRGSVVVVARWHGDGDHTGDGSNIVAIRRG
jgi:photosystem II stability/assembly factor-like uncharacterized protein